MENVVQHARIKHKSTAQIMFSKETFDAVFSVQEI